MPTKYTVSAPDGAARWCTALAKLVNFTSNFQVEREPVY